jgi:hypothetical protein
MRISAALACLAVGLISLTGSANAAPISWNIVSSASSISLAIPNQTLTITSTSSIASGLIGTSLTISMRALNPGTGTASTPTGWTIGNKEQLSGTLQTDTDFLTNISFLDVQAFPNTSPTIINGIDSGSYAPLADGSAGTASGDFGTRIYAGSGVILGGLNLDFAFRNVLYDLISGSIPITATSFPSNQTDFGIENADLAFKSRNGFGLGGSTFVGLVGSGAANIGGTATDNTAGAGSLVVTPKVGGDLAKLTVPITQTLVIPLDSDGLLFFKINVSGVIVATAIVPEPATIGMLAVGMAMLAPVAVRRWRKRS